jgi:uncharacterized membrane protein
MLNFVTLLCALGCGLIAGAFFAFSSFVMKALGIIPPVQGLTAMQSINIVVINPWFLTPFVGTAALCLLTAGAAIMRWHDPGASYLLAGSVLYVVGTFVVTMAFNVPRNDALAALKPASPEAASFWATFVTEWTIWNHVRTVAALAAATAFTIAYRLRP